MSRPTSPPGTVPVRALAPDGDPGTASFVTRIAAMVPGAPVPSPCIDVCRIDARSGRCQGCRRTLDEIAAWSGLDDGGRRAIWARLPGRED